MSPFLAAQALDPFDPAPMLIQADWLEERGDAIGASVLRALADVGTLSLHALALEATLHPAAWIPDVVEGAGADGAGLGAAYGSGDWFGGASGNGYGLGDGFEDDRGDGEGCLDQDDPSG